MTVDQEPSEKLGDVQYAIFDMDGLLSAVSFYFGLDHIQTTRSWFADLLARSNSEEMWTEITNGLLRKYGFEKPYSWDYKVQTMGRPPRQSSEKLFSFYPGLEKRITVDEWIAERNALHEEAFKRVQLLPGALSLVKRLHDAGVPMAIATGSNNKNFKWKTSHLPELFSLFPPECIFTADSKEAARGKPHPDIYLAAARGLGQDVGTPDEQPTAEQIANRKRGIVFEDAVLGVEAGISAGMQVIWVPHNELRKIYGTETFGSAQTLDSLADFKPEQWGLKV